MSIDRTSPEFISLLAKVERRVGLKPQTHNDFVVVRDRIIEMTKEHISETTLERLWGYSSRGYKNTSLRTLNVLSKFLGHKSWDGFCKQLLTATRTESDMFDLESVSTDDLNVGDCVTIGWLPNRRCTLRYLGDNRFVAVEAVNAKLQPGDTCMCLQLQLGSPLILDDLRAADGSLRSKRYGAGLKHGLTMLRLCGGAAN